MSLKRSILVAALSGLIFMIGCGKDKNDNLPAPSPVVVVNDNNIHAKNGWEGQLQITDRSMYQRFLEDHNVCDFPGTTWTFGTWNCDNYNGLWVGLHLNALTAPMNGFARILHFYKNQRYALNASVLEGQFLPIDQNTGIELYRRGYDFTATYNAIFRYRITGDLKKDNGLQMEVYYRGVKFGQSTLYRLK